MQQPDYAPLLAETVAGAPRPRRWSASSTRCWCASAARSWSVVPGRVSTEVDARPVLRHRRHACARARDSSRCTKPPACRASAC
ncbi:MAG: hypothetical protein MZW92_34600 [Comamonadaceae bacterium]|nr:hypothetical protein [Comamonadaceae bacterium]